MHVGASGCSEHGHAEAPEEVVVLVNFSGVDDEVEMGEFHNFVVASNARPKASFIGHPFKKSFHCFVECLFV